MRPLAPWSSLSRRSATIPMLLVGVALAALVALAPLFGWAPRIPTSSAAALGMALLLAAIAVVFWKDARESGRVRRALSAGVSHDLRTPLTQIRMFTEMLLMGCERSEEERARWLESIERESHRLGEVIENLLLFIHGEEPNPYPARQPTDLGALVEDVAVGFAARAAARQMRIEADPPAGILVMADPQAVRQVVGNLLDNALRYGPAGQTVTVTLTTRRKDHAVLTVTDQGPGVAFADRARVWQPFTRLEDLTAAEGGSGLGLAVVRQVVEAHGGQTSITRAPAGGARVNATFPILTAAGSHVESGAGKEGPRLTEESSERSRPLAGEIPRLAGTEFARPVEPQPLPPSELSR